MYSKISKLLVVLTFVGLVSYIFYYNPQEIQINFGDSTKINTPLALALVISFFTGVILTTIFAIYFGLKSKYEKWRLQKKISLQESHYLQIAKAEDLIALADAETARGLLNKIIGRDSTDILARLALSRSFLINGNSNAAIKVLEETRASERRAPSVLIELAKAYEKTGNNSAALDNILLCLKENPKSVVLLEKATALAEVLGKLDDAEKFAMDLLKVCPYAEQQRIQDILAEVKFKKLQHLRSSKKDDYLQGLLSLTKVHKDFEPALMALAEEQFSRNESSLAVKTLQRALKKGRSYEALNRLVSFWVSSQNPGAAISLLKETINNSDTQIQISARILLAQLQLQLENLEQAEIEIKALDDILSGTSSERSVLEILKAKLESKIPGRAKVNSSLENILINESKKAGVPALTVIKSNNK